MWTAGLLCGVIVAAVLALGWTVGRHGALRAERVLGGWAWPIYAGLGSGMIFGAVATSHLYLSAFMWTKVSVFLATGLWLASRWLRTRVLSPTS